MIDDNRVWFSDSCWAMVCRDPAINAAWFCNADLDDVSRKLSGRRTHGYAPGRQGLLAEEVLLQGGDGRVEGEQPLAGVLQHSDIVLAQGCHADVGCAGEGQCLSRPWP